MAPFLCEGLSFFRHVSSSAKDRDRPIAALFDFNTRAQHGKRPLLGKRFFETYLFESGHMLRVGAKDRIWFIHNGHFRSFYSRPLIRWDLPLAPRDLISDLKVNDGSLCFVLRISNDLIAWGQASHLVSP